MIDKLIIEATEDTPGITFDPEIMLFEIKGRSLPENVNLLFTPVMDWLGSYFNAPVSQTILRFKLDYFNSASAKKIVELLLFLEGRVEKGNKIEIIWYYKEHDTTMEKKGKDLLGIFNVPYKMVIL